MNDNIPYQTLFTGFRSPPHNASGPELFVLRSQVELERKIPAVQGKAPQYHVNWDKDVAMWALSAVGSGLDEIPEVVSLTGDDKSIRLVIRLRPAGHPTMLDVTTQPWIMIAVAKERLAKHPAIEFEVEGQGRGPVSGTE